MTAIDVAGPAPTAPAAVISEPAPLYRRTGRFHGTGREFFALLVRGSLLLMVTLGIYRFWLATDIRRFLWGHTEVSNEGLEYTGTARELLIGFLMAIALLVPVNGFLFLGTLAPNLLPYSGTIGFILLALLGQFAIFRARRYRLTRTVYRGLRLYQTGSAWRYSIMANLWWIPILLTAGLAYPWALASLERYKMRNTYYGNLQGRFEGRGTQLFLRGALLWLIILAPFTVALLWAVTLVNWSALATALSGDGTPSWTQIESSNPALGQAMAAGLSALIWAALAAMLLYPVFRAIVLRWWISGLRIGGIEAKSHLRTGQVYGAYLAFIGYSMLFGTIIGVAGMILALLGVAAHQLLGLASQSSAVEIGTVVVGVAAYVIVMLGYSAIYQATVTLRMWRLSFEMTELNGVEALEHVQAAGGPSSAFGEGLADALDVGGL